MKLPDFNLLLVFDALMAERSVSGAARRLNRSQPAVSQSLARLRDIFGDILFTRSARGLIPTPRATQLWEDFQQPLHQLQTIFGPHRFNPASARLRMTFGAAEDIEFLLLPGIINMLKDQLSEARFDVQPTDWQSVNEDLMRGRFDIAFTISGDAAPGIRREALMKTGFSCLYDPAILPPPTSPLSWYLEAEHIVVTFSDGRPTFISEYFDAIGQTRRRHVSTRAILATPHYVLGSKAIATMPTPIAHMFVQRYGLAAIPLPLEAWHIDYSMLWSEKHAQNPALAWVLNEIRRWIQQREHL